MSGTDPRWKLHLPVTDREALGPERAEQLTNAIRRIERELDNKEGACEALEEQNARLITERDAAQAQCASAERELNEAWKRIDKMCIDEPIALDAPCFYCDGAPTHATDCLYRPSAHAPDGASASSETKESRVCLGCGHFKHSNRCNCGCSMSPVTFNPLEFEPIVLGPEAFAKVMEMIERPADPTEALKALFRKRDDYSSNQTEKK